MVVKLLNCGRALVVVCGLGVVPIALAREVPKDTIA